MNGEEEIRLSKSDYAFRMHMVKFTGRADETFRKLEEQNAGQFMRIERLERAPRRMAVIASAVATTVSTVLVGVLEAIRNRG